ncbi:hypothetical protein QM334_38930, partial [Burkholderia cenocepacia]|nr:hypothetical protein [Burkholderia cenocepacia]
IGGTVARTLVSGLAIYGRFVSYGAASGQLLTVDDALMNALIFGCRSVSGFALHAFLNDDVVRRTLGELFGLLATVPPIESNTTSGPSRPVASLNCSAQCASR